MGKEDEQQQQLHAVRFAAGVGVLMACLERAALVSFFEQWRVWVFLALNLLLLAILFTSTSYTTCGGSTPPNEVGSSAEEENMNTNDVERKKRIWKQCSNLEATKSSREDKPKPKPKPKIYILKSESMREEIIRNYTSSVEEEEEVEELNEKVEAFIAMFRQQYLVSDNSKVTSRRRRRKSHEAASSYGPFCPIPYITSVGHSW